MEHNNKTKEVQETPHQYLTIKEPKDSRVDQPDSHYKRKQNSGLKQNSANECTG